MVLATNLMSRLPKDKRPSMPANVLCAFTPYGEGVNSELERLALLLPRPGNLLYSRMGNRQLQTETFNFVGRLRDFTILWQAKVRLLEDAQSNKRVSEAMATNRIVMMQRWNQERKEENTLRREHRAEFVKSFHAEALILREELLSRYPKDDSPPSPRQLGARPRTIADDLHFFQWCSNVGRFDFIADTLEVLAKQLPVRK